MTSPIISVESLSKAYLVGHQSASTERYTALRDVIGRSVKNFGRKALDMARGKQIIQGDEVEEFWALKDVSFDVNEGEVVGIIGHNGAGKSTLLKILSRITEPTSGRVTLRGRVASLLEVGTGFHPELTGRENIFLNGAILGMSRADIKRKFDEIVDFAGVEKFLDTPVKRYSSGMYVRLAFAVAAHLEPEILVVDEVLAVGDAEFQKKCLGKMQDVAAGGRTVLFVSHNLNALARVCPVAICLKNGTVASRGKTQEVLAQYRGELSNTIQTGIWHDLKDRCDRTGNGAGILTGFQIESTKTDDVDVNYTLTTKSGILLTAKIEATKELRLSSVAFVISTLDGIKLVNADSHQFGEDVVLKNGINTISIQSEQLCLKPGRYNLGIWLSEGAGSVVDHIKHVGTIEVSRRKADRNHRTPDHDGLLDLDFSITVEH